MRESAPAYDRLLALIDDFAGIRVAVFGDLLADEFIYGQIARVSREAPVLILDYDSTEIVPGGAGNAANNVAALGGTPSAIGVAGADETGQRLLEALGRGVNLRGIVQPRGYRTPTKTRILAGGVHSAKQQVVRIDRAVRPELTAADRRAIEARLVWAAARCDALLVSDYGTGLVTPAVVRRASQRFAGPGRPRAGARRFALRAAPVPRDDDLHAERVRSRAAVRHHVSATTCACSKRPDASCWRRRRSQAGADHARQPRDGALRAGSRRPSTFRSPDRIRSRTSPGPATRSSPR